MWNGDKCRSDIHLCMTSEIAWEWYRSFLEVARSGSLSAAARAMGTTQPTVGRHIDALEKHLQQRLFVRTPTGLLATEQGRVLLPYAQSLEHTVAALERVATNRPQQVVGTVRITASEVLAVEVLPSILQPLLQAHLGLQLELVASDRSQDLLQREADIAVRMHRPMQDALIAQQVGRSMLGLYAHPNYLQRKGAPQHMQDLLSGQYTLIGFDATTPFVRSLLQQWPEVQRAMFALRTDNAAASLALMRQGAGIGLCHSKIAQTHGLLPVLPHPMTTSLDVWLAMHADLRSSPCCQTVFQALSCGLQDYFRPDAV